MSVHLSWAILSVIAVGSLPAQGQAQSVERSPSAAVEDLQDGRITNPSLFMFDGCPQNDPTGRAVFEAVQNLELQPDGIEELAMALNWSGQYGECNYAPLNTWFVRAFDTIVERRAGAAAFAFVRRLPAPIPPEMQEALLRASEDEVWGDEVLRPMFATVAVFNRPRERQVAEAIAAFRRGVPLSWIHDATVRLGREHGSSFFQSLVAAAPTLPDSVLDRVSGAVAMEVRDGRVRPDEPGLAQFRAHVATREGVAQWNRVPTTAEPVGR